MKSENVESLIERLRTARVVAKEKELLILSELFAHAVEFETYAELYFYVKLHSETVEDFNLSMQHVMPLWFRAHPNF